MRASKTLQVLVFTALNFLVLFLGSNEVSSFAYDNAIRFLAAKSEYSYDLKDHLFNQRSPAPCLGPFYENSKLYQQASNLRRYGVFPKKEVLEVGNFDQEFVVIGNNLFSGESAIISKELSLLDVSHFKVASSEGFEIYIEAAQEGQARELQFDELASLGRPLDYVVVQRRAILYFLRVHEADGEKLSHIKEKRCIGIAPLH